MTFKVKSVDSRYGTPSPSNGSIGLFHEVMFLVMPAFIAEDQVAIVPKLCGHVLGVVEDHNVAAEEAKAKIMVVLGG
uniref:Uncharacterized protein n=1 Tax=Oryza sativa subsp. japonica TaxID=39947 RepID=Q75GC1_ORYSJ|nr:hypothetical protein [Oryza sativa Japonica Group]